MDDIFTTLSSFAPDGSGVVGRHPGFVQKGDIFFPPIPATGETLVEPKPLVTGPGDERGGKVSSDGRWIASTSDESGRSEVYIAAFGPGGTVGDEESDEVRRLSVVLNFSKELVEKMKAAK